MSESWVALFTSQTALCTLPIAVLVIISSLDAADKQLLASSFPMLSETLGLDVETLGYFSFFTNGAYALSLPMWGFLVHKYGLPRVHYLLAVACGSWGLSTIGIAFFGNSIVWQAIFRALVGVALGSIMPLSQTLLVELVDVTMRGRAFGLMLLCEKLAGTLAAASVVYLDVWEIPYYVLGMGSLGMGYLSLKTLSPSSRKQSMMVSTTHSDGTEKEYSPDQNEEAPSQLTLRQIVQRIVRMPAFMCMVAQGVFGGTPWDMMSFLLLLMDWRGFTKGQIVSIQFSYGLTATVGGWMGGYLGDYTAHRWGIQGRIWLAFVSVLGGIPLYGLYLFATDYLWAMLWINAFHLWGTWTQSGALRPICADLTRSTSERAQIISLWIVLEKLSGAIFGAPLVGYLTSNMLAKGAAAANTTNGGAPQGGEVADKANTLAFYLFLLSSVFWTICAFFWAVMSLAMKWQDQQSLSLSSIPQSEPIDQDQKLSTSTALLDGDIGARRRTAAPSNDGEVELHSLL
jgi:MFS family permease